MRLRSVVSAELQWIALGSDCLSVQVASAACDGRSYSSAMHIAAFSSLYDEVKAVEGCGTGLPCCAYAVRVCAEAGLTLCRCSVVVCVVFVQ